jgi:hypothetical protein
MYKPSDNPAHKWTWNTAFRSPVACGRRSQPFTKGTLFPTFEESHGVPQFGNVPCQQKPEDERVARQVTQRSILQSGAPVEQEQ